MNESVGIIFNAIKRYKIRQKAAVISLRTHTHTHQLDLFNIMHLDASWQIHLYSIWLLSLPFFPLISEQEE